MWPPIGVFLHVNTNYSDGMKMLGLSLDSLHSDEVDPDGLKVWTHAFSNAFSRVSRDGQMTPRPKFHDEFLEQLRCFCVYVASLDGSLNNEVIDAINWLIDDSSLNSANASDLVLYTNSDKWTRWYPDSFQFLVFGIARDENEWNGTNITAASQVFCFYRQVARFIYSINHDNPLDENRTAFEYLESYRKYIERVSISGFHSPNDDKSIENVCDAWQFMTNMERDLFGVWRSANGSAPFSGGPLSFTIGRNGQGYMTSKLLVLNKRTDIVWGFMETFHEIVPEIGVPELDLRAYLELTDTNQLQARFSCPGKRWDKTTGIYRRP